MSVFPTTPIIPHVPVSLRRLRSSSFLLFVTIIVAPIFIMGRCPTYLRSIVLYKAVGVSGVPRINDDESSRLEYFSVNALPELESRAEYVIIRCSEISFPRRISLCSARVTVLSEISAIPAYTQWNFGEAGLKAERFELLDVLSGSELFFRYPNGDETYTVIVLYKAVVPEYVNGMACNSNQIFTLANGEMVLQKQFWFWKRSGLILCFTMKYMYERKIVIKMNDTKYCSLPRSNIFSPLKRLNLSVTTFLLLSTYSEFSWSSVYFTAALYCIAHFI